MTTTTTSSRARRRIGRMVGALLVPLAFAGLVLAAIAPDSTDAGAIPAAIVNDDQAIVQTDADGQEQYVLAGRLLVTRLTGDDSGGFDWRISSSAQAEAALASGEVRAVLTIPEGFSQAITSLSSDSPMRAQLRIRTDESHDALTGRVADAVGDGMVAEFGQTITEQFLAGMLGQVGGIGGSIAEAADGATQLGDGADSLAGGVDSLSAGLGELSNGVADYTSGVTALAAGLDQLNGGAQQLGGLSSGVGDYTAGVADLSAALNGALQQLQADPTNPVALGTVQAIAGQLEAVAAGGASLSAQAGSALSGIQSGIAQSAGGARALAAGGSQLRGGATSAAEGASQLSDGALSLADGARALADGLAAGAAQSPSAEPGDSTAIAEVAARPIELATERANPLPDARAAMVIMTVPLGLWLGALTAQLLGRGRARAEALAATTTGRMLRARLGIPLLFAGVQGVLLALLVHIGTGISWSAFPATLGFTILVAAAFALIHQLFASVFHRGAVVVSLLLLAVQLTSAGGIYPLQLVAGPFQALSPALPLTHAVAGLQTIATGGATSTMVTSLMALVVFAGLSLLATALVLRARRASARSLPLTSVRMADA